MMKRQSIYSHTGFLPVKVKHSAHNGKALFNPLFNIFLNTSGN